MSQSQPASQKSALLTRPIPGMMRQIAVPVSVGAFFQTMFNLVDTIYGGLISDQALAALSLSFPIYFIIVALGFGFSQGNTALMGNALGRDDTAEAQRYAVQGVTFGILLSLVTTAVVLSFTPALVTAMGATEESYRQMALAYVNPIFIGAIFFITNQMLQAILNTLGDTKPGRNFLFAGFLLNIILDPWFIFGGLGLPPLGITGIALATVLVQFLGCIYIGYKVIKTDLISWECLRRYWLPNPKAIYHIVEQGFPNMIDLMGVSFGFFVLTYFVGQFGQGAVAALGAASRLEQVALLPLLGLNIASLSLVSRNNGAGQIGRVQETFKMSLLYGAGIMFMTMIVIAIFARPLMSLFTEDPAIISTGVAYVQIRSLGLVPNAIFFMSSAAMRGIKRPFVPLFLNMMRFVILPALFIYIFVQQLGFGLTTIWITSTIAFFIAGSAGYLTAYRMLPQPS